MENKQITLNGLISDDKFLSIVGDVLAEIKQERKIRPAAPVGYHYKRDTFDVLSDNNNLRIDYIIENIHAIYEKKSNLSSNIRAFIKGAFEIALRRYLKSIEHEKV